MKINENEVIQFIEPILHFCTRRLHNRCDAEDLASEIMVHVLSGIRKYEIDSLEKWIWRIAHNRYARFIDARSKNMEISSSNTIACISDDYDFVDSVAISYEYETVFKYLHTLSAEYKNITVDYYIANMTVKQLSEKYGLSESTVKWRLNISRKKMRNRIGECQMEKVYKRINWKTTTCNGSMDSNRYLYSQIARGICEAAYEKPLTVEEISLKTGLPTMYIEDEMPRLIYGDAIVKDGNKYATNFIILRLRDKKILETNFEPLVKDIAEYYESLFKKSQEAVEKMSFYGADFTLKRLGYIALPASLRKKVWDIKRGIKGMEDGPYPPRQDGGFGWFIIEETETDNEKLSTLSSGCNCTGNDNNEIYYYWIGKYFNHNIYHNQGTTWLSDKKIPEKTIHGVIPDGYLTEDDCIRLLKANLIERYNEGYRLTFACFTESEFKEFISLFIMDNDKLNASITGLILDINKSFKQFVPARLESQINQWVSCYVHNIIGIVAEELIRRSVLRQPNEDIPLIDGVFHIKGKYQNV